MDFNRYNNTLPLNIFRTISKIPRKSGDEKAISDYLIEFALNYNLECKRDDSNNVIIKKQGQNGGECSKPVVLQAHMDMVYVKRSEGKHLYYSPLDISMSDGIIKAKDTSLGADNGIGMSYILALLASNDIKHPPIEALFTTGEENGLLGAAQLKKDWISGTSMINLDGENEEVILAGSAGGIICELELDIAREAVNQEWSPYLVGIYGLKGGHSGLEIGNGRANAIKVLGRVLNSVFNKMPALLVRIDGGEHTSAIPNSCEAELCVEQKNETLLFELIDDLSKTLKREFACTDSCIDLQIDKVYNDPKFPIGYKDSEKIIETLMILPDGVLVMSKEVDGNVQTSVNVGLIKTLDDTVSILSNARSCYESQKKNIANQVHSISRLIGAKFTTSADYPAWTYTAMSPLRELSLEEYVLLNGKVAKIETIHGGLECGYIKEKYPDMDIISIGPNIHEVHTVNEWAEMESVMRVWEYLKNILFRM